MTAEFFFVPYNCTDMLEFLGGNTSTFSLSFIEGSEGSAVLPSYSISTFNLDGAWNRSLSEFYLLEHHGRNNLGVE